MNPVRILYVLLARWKLVVPVFLIAALVGVAVAWRMPKVYTSTATVFVDARADPVAGISQIASPNFLATQVDIIRSSRVAARVVRLLGLQEDAQLRALYEKLGAQGDFEGWLAKLVQRPLAVEPGRGSNVINITYGSEDPVEAAKRANTFVRAYLDTVLEMRIEPARRYAEFFDERARTMREALEQAEARLSAYHREKGIVANDERLDIENAKLGELSSQLVQLQALASESSSRQAQSRAQADRTPEVMANGLVTNLKGEVAKQEAQLSELRSRLGENHPQVVSIKASLAELQARIEAETRRVTGSVGVNNTVNRQREAEARAALEAQRARVLRMRESRDALAVLQRDVENARRAYDNVQQRLVQSNLESQNQQTNVSILNEAEVPGYSTRDIFVKMAVMAVGGAAGLAFAVALALEFLDKRVRVIEDVAGATDLPVIGVLPGPDRHGPLKRRLAALRQRRLLRQLPAPSHS